MTPRPFSRFSRHALDKWNITSHAKRVIIKKGVSNLQNGTAVKIVKNNNENTYYYEYLQCRLHFINIYEIIDIEFPVDYECS